MGLYSVYVANSLANTVSVCAISSTGQKKVAAMIPVGKYPRCIALSANGSFAAVTNYKSDSVSIIRTTTNKVVFEITAIPSPSGIAFGKTQQWERLYVASSLDQGVIYVFNPQNYQIVAQIPVGKTPAWVTISSDSQFVYVTNFNSNTVSIIDTGLNAVVNTVPVCFHPGQIAASSSGKVYLVPQCMNLNFQWIVQVFDLTANAVTEIPLNGIILFAVTVNPQGKAAYVTDCTAGVGSVTAIDTMTGNLSSSLKIGVWPKGGAFSPDGNYCFFSDYSLNSLIVVDTQKFSVFTKLNLGAGSGPFGVAVRN